MHLLDQRRAFSRSPRHRDKCSAGGGQGGRGGAELMDGGVDGQRIDGHRGRRHSHRRWAVRKAFRMRGVGGVESELATGGDVSDAAIEYVGWCEERKARVLVNVIIPAEEFLA